ncbi:hypothetical protein SAMN05421743_10186 [Thalassobacillus cyri]|uniref:Uncharacterized protein n=1 Tax=Thalassobacillus cyri TaxID=571932 RepID=A0A1H3VNZ9_9BACI|nr:hypothetical protein [Thalassobacillus cyri]SDZ75822.1 hypothetical protein SAMN05421743_10186 [Thalassobacillus cyri]
MNLRHMRRMIDEIDYMITSKPNLKKPEKTMTEFEQMMVSLEKLLTKQMGEFEKRTETKVDRLRKFFE